MLGSFTVIQITKLWIFRSKNQFSYSSQCSEIQSMFGSNMTLFEEEARRDLSYIK
jgi:hypothetical protein